MPHDEFAEVAGQRRRFAVVAASAVSVVLLTAAVIGVRSWRDVAERSPAVDDTARTTSSASPFANSVSSPAAASASGPAFSSVPMLSPAPIVSPAPSSPARQQSPSSSPTIRHPSPPTPAVADESHLNFNVTMRLSPAHVMLGQPTRVTVTIVNAGHGIDPPAEVSIGSMVPADDFSNAPSDCTIANGGVECPVPKLQAGRAKTIAFTVTTGYYPADTWDDEIFGQLAYADSYGQQQDLEPGYSAHLLVSAGPPSSSPPTSAAPSSATPTPSLGG